VAVGPVLLEAEQDDVMTCSFNAEVPEHLVRVEQGENLLVLPAPVFFPVPELQQRNRGSEWQVAGTVIPFRREAGYRDGAGFSCALVEITGHDHALPGRLSCGIIR
jgi:hypothetical protein